MSDKIIFDKRYIPSPTVLEKKYVNSKNVLQKNVLIHFKIPIK